MTAGAQPTPNTRHPTPRVSVVLPTCNREDITRRCLLALAAQRHDAFEVITIDDGSTDNTPRMLQELAAQHPTFNLRVITNPTNIGANNARNRGIHAAHAPIIAFLDSDCIAEPDWLTNLEHAINQPGTAAVTGLVLDPDPKNVYDLAFRGTHRVVTKGPAPRLVAGNMALHTPILKAFMFDERFSPNARHPDGTPDTSVSGRSDEAGLAINLKRAGHTLRSAPDAVVLHEHHYTRRSFFRQAFRSGRAAQRLVHRFRLPPRPDTAPLAAAYLTLPPAAAAAILLPPLGPIALLAPLACFALAGAAYAYNELARKGKTAAQLARCAHIVIAYHHARLAGYALQWLRYRLKLDRPQRDTRD